MTSVTNPRSLPNSAQHRPEAPETGIAPSAGVAASSLTPTSDPQDAQTTDPVVCRLNITEKHITLRIVAFLRRRSNRTTPHERPRHRRHRLSRASAIVRALAGADTDRSCSRAERARPLTLAGCRDRRRRPRSRAVRRRGASGSTRSATPPRWSASGSGGPTDFDDVNVGGLRDRARRRATRHGIAANRLHLVVSRAAAGRRDRRPLEANDYQRTKVRAREVARAAAPRGVPIVIAVPRRHLRTGRRDRGQSRRAADSRSSRAAGCPASSARDRTSGRSRTSTTWPTRTCGRWSAANRRGITSLGGENAAADARLRDRARADGRAAAAADSDRPGRDLGGRRRRTSGPADRTCPRSSHAGPSGSSARLAAGQRASVQNLSISDHAAGRRAFEPLLAGDS